MSASIILSSLALASDGKTLTGTLSGGSGSGYSPSSGVTGFSILVGGNTHHQASATISGTTLTITLEALIASGATVTLDIAAGNLVDSGSNTMTLSTGNAVTNNSTVSLTTFASSNTAFQNWGRFTASTVAGGHDYKTLSSFNSSIAFTATGTHCQALCYGGGFQVSVDGGAFSDVTSEAAWGWNTLFTGLSDAAHTVVLRASSFGAIIDNATSISVKGSSPSLAAYDASNYYIMANTPFSTYGLIEGGLNTSTDAFYNTPNQYNSGWPDSRARFIVTGGTGIDLYIWGYSDGGYYAWSVNGVKQATVGTANTGTFGWVSIATGQTLSDGDIITITCPRAGRYIDAVRLVGTALKSSAPSAQAKVAAIGDSTTAGNITLDSTESWVFKLAQYLVAEPNNRGIGGNTTSQVAARAGTDLPADADVVVVLTGFNDLGSDATTFKTNYRAVVDNILTRCVSIRKLICHAILTGINATFNTKIQDVVSEVANAKVIYHATPASFDGTAGVDTVDGTHPNASGGTKIANSLSPVAAVSAFSITGPSSGVASIASSAFTVTLAGGATFSGSDTITLTASDGTITATAASGSISGNGTGTVIVTPASTATAFTYTYTPASSGSKTITYTNGQSWDNPASSSYAASVPDTTPPTVTAASINTDGDTLTLTFSESVTGGTGFSLSGGATLGSATGSGSSRTFSISPTVKQGQTRTLSYSGGDVVDGASNALATFSGADVTNDSTVVAAASAIIAGGGKRFFPVLKKKKR